MISQHTRGCVRRSLPGRLVPGLMLLALLATAARAQSVGANRAELAGNGGNRTIKGQIYLPGGDTKNTRFKVRLENTDAGTLVTSTDADGQFNFNGLTAGSFTIIVEGTDEWDSMRESLYLDQAGGSRVNIVPFYMRRKPSADPAFAGIPAGAIDFYIKGNEAAQKGDHKKAAEQFEKAVGAYPTFVQAYNGLGMAYLKQGNVDKAHAALSTALKLKPEDAEINLNYGIALLQKKDFAGAEEHLRLALKQHGEMASSHYYLGLALVSQKKIDDAQGELERAITLPGGDNYALAHRYLGGIYWGKGDYKRAADELEKYLKLSPKATDAEQTKNAIKELRSKK
ncbi:MAG: tetratricopeptide repeat protein [Acidobacteria bacterium]|nr:tetratricopeptide repeat protein [Acidobacteriota bacterium]